MWHAERKSCFWVDIEDGILYECKWVNKEIKSWKFDYKLSLVVEANDNHVILGFNGGIARFNLQSEVLEWLVDIEKELPGNRSNDGACDTRGRLWIGTMDRQQRKDKGSLYCIDKKLDVHKKIEKVTISNGLAWSPDNRRLYYIDSPTKMVQAFLFNEESGEITFEKIAIQIPAGLGSPDGIAIDEEGMLWIAHWGGFGVYRWNPVNGKLIEKVDIPVPNVSSCAFAGEKLDHLIVTTARENLSKEDLRKYPASGDVFCISTNVRGMAKNKCIF